MILLDAILGACVIVALWAAGVLPALPSLPAVGGLPIVVAVAAALTIAAGLTVRRCGGALRRSPPRREASQSWAAPGSTSAPCFPSSSPPGLAGVVYFVMEAFPIETGVATAVLVVVLNGAATALPVPGGAGSQQVLATYALQGVVSAAGAVSFSLSMQVGMTAVNTAVGLAAVMLLFRTLRPLAALRAAR